MEWINETLKSTEIILTLISKSDYAFWLTLSGIFFFIIHVTALVQLFKTSPEETTRFVKFVALASLVLATIFSAAGPATALMRSRHHVVSVVSKKERMVNLRDNKEVQWLIRLIPYNPDNTNDSDKRLDKLTHLGPDLKDYTFVNSYDEMKGRKVKDALLLAGISKEEEAKKVDRHVIAIIFPVDEKIYPANARGLIQVVRKIEDVRSIPLYSRFMEGKFGDDEKDDLRRAGSPTLWAFDSYKSHYAHYCKVAYRFICGPNKPIELEYLSIGQDLHPSGAALKSNNGYCAASDSQCDIADWDSLASQIEGKFGSRVFLMQNADLSTLRTKIMIDFDDPNTQRIPEIFDDSGN